MKFSRIIPEKDLFDDTRLSQVLITDLHHDLVSAIAKEHMDHDIMVRSEDNGDGTITLSVEY